jgi:hypothetical protein
MVLPVIGCIIGIATWAKSKQDGAVLDFNFVGVQMSGEFAQTHSVRKLIACCEIILCCCNPPLIGTNQTCGIRVGLDVSIGMADLIGVAAHGNCCSGGVGIGGSTTMGRGFAFAIGGTLSGILFLVCQECVRFVSFNTHLVVGLGAAMIGGASVMRASTGCGSLCTISRSTSPPITL